MKQLELAGLREPATTPVISLPARVRDELVTQMSTALAAVILGAREDYDEQPDDSASEGDSETSGTQGSSVLASVE